MSLIKIPYPIRYCETGLQKTGLGFFWNETVNHNGIMREGAVGIEQGVRIVDQCFHGCLENFEIAFKKDQALVTKDLGRQENSHQ